MASDLFWIKLPCLTCIILVWTILPSSMTISSDRRAYNIGILQPSLFDLMDVVFEKVENSSGQTLNRIQVLDNVRENYRGYRKVFSATKSLDTVLGPYKKAYAIATEKSKIPFLVTSITPAQQRETPFLIQLFPDATVFADAVLDIVNYYQYTSIAVIYDSIEGAVVLEKLLMQPSKEVTSIKINDSVTSQVKQELKAIRDNRFTNFIIICKNRTIADLVLTEGLRLSMFSRPYTWLLVNMGLEEYDLEKYVDSRVNMTIVAITADPGSPSCILGEDISLKRAVLSDALQVYVNLQRNLNVSMRSAVGNLDLQGCTGHLNFTEFGKRSEFSLRLLELRNYRSGKAGSWTSVEDSFKRRVKPSQSYSISRGMVSGNVFDRPIRITTKIEPPFVQYKNESNYQSGDASVHPFEGLLIDILEQLAKVLDFRYNITLVPDGKFGSLKPPPRGWTGMVRVLKDDKADVALAPFQITPGRSAVVDFTKPFMTKGTTVMVRRPEFKVGHFQFLRPLSKYVWIAIFVAFVIVSLVLFGVSRVNTDRQAKYTHNLRASFWYIWGTLLRGSLCGAPKAISSRTISSTWWFFSLIIISIYTANLAAFLTITISSIGINSAADLAQQDILQYGTVDGSQIEYFFNHTKMDHFQKMKAMMSVQPGWMVRTVKIGFERVMQGGYAFIWDSPTIRHLVASDCSLMEIGTPFDLKGYGLAVRKNAPYLEKISLAILKLIDEGVVYRLEGKWWRRQYCPDPRQKAKTESLDFENVAGMFIILAAGIILALVVCAVEYIVGKLRAKVNPSKKREPPANNTHNRNSDLNEANTPDMLGDIQVYSNHITYAQENHDAYKRYSEYESRL
ncbi:glutamate receptor ionotropic, kainate 2 [Patella vulgata]|uniref:glutamate receptor ionotropic, kainate 2 n=1 Tax=Patella vulgata TaxID=6465 RepID=UPI0024A95BBC|nr:glutamate receptor ionotropic, kainate 2 [Patella vulgata]